MTKRVFTILECYEKYPNIHEFILNAIKEADPAFIKELLDYILTLQNKVRSVNSRVFKLVEKGEFVAVGENEPYYFKVCELIRKQEIKQGTWTEDDRIWYAAQQLKGN